MSLFSRGSKPGWEAGDPRRRSEAVASADAATIGAHLPELARNDPDAGVRCAAVRRLEDLALLSDRMRNDIAAPVRDAARERLKQLYGGELLGLAERERVLRVEEDAALLAWIAANAPQAPLRRLALERCNRPAFIVERCMRDPDLALRLWLLERIDALPALQRIADAVRTSDKQLSRRARERILEQKLAHGDPATLRERALAICDELDALRRNRPDDTGARTDALRQEWEKLQARVPAELTPRVAGYFAALAAAERPLRVADPEPETSPEVAPAAVEAAAGEPRSEALPMAPATPEPEPEPEPQPEPQPESGLEAEPQAAVAEPVPEALQTRESANAAPRPSREEIERHLTTVREAVESGQLTIARLGLGVLRDLRSTHRGMPAGLAHRIAECEQAVGKLAQWQHWSNNRIRSRLCEELAALPAAGLHPDAVAAKVKAAQAEWQALAASERDPDAAERPEGRLAQRFRALCHRALAPTRPYFEKRREVRAERLSAHAALLEEAAQCDDKTDPRVVAGVRRRVGDALRRIDELDPRVRGETSRRLRQAMSRFDALRDARKASIAAADAERNAVAEAAKRKLLANLRRELQRVSLGDALARATGAQEQWARLGNAAPDVEAALARELHELVDPWFEKSRAAGEARQAERNARELEERSILSELRDLAGADAETMRQADARLATLTARWRTLFAPPPEAPATGRRPGGFERERRPERRPRPVEATRAERDFDRAVERVREAQQAAVRTRELASMDQVRELANRCNTLEGTVMEGALDASGDEPTPDWARLPPDTVEAMRRRYENAVASAASGTPPDASLLARNDASAAALAVRVEALAGLATPDAWVALRRQVQVQRLAERMGGGVQLEPRDESRRLLLEWLALGPLSREAREEFAPRIDAAFAELARR